MCAGAFSASRYPPPWENATVWAARHEIKATSGPASGTPQPAQAGWTALVAVLVGVALFIRLAWLTLIALSKITWDGAERSKRVLRARYVGRSTWAPRVGRAGVRRTHSAIPHRSITACRAAVRTSSTFSVTNARRRSRFTVGPSSWHVSLVDRIAGGAEATAGTRRREGCQLCRIATRSLPERSYRATRCGRHKRLRCLARARTARCRDRDATPVSVARLTAEVGSVVGHDGTTVVTNLSNFLSAWPQRTWR